MKNGRATAAIVHRILKSPTVKAVNHPGLLLRQRHTRMQISQQRCHLLLGKPPRKTRHLPFPHQHQPPHLGIRSRRTTRQLLPDHRPMNIRRRRFQSQVVLLMAMRTPHRIQVLTLDLLRGKRRPATASGKQKGQPSRKQHCRPNSPTLSLNFPPNPLLTYQLS